MLKGGHFLISASDCQTVFTPEDFTEEQKMIATLTEDFVEKEVVPQLDYLENHEFERTVRLLNKAGELGLLSADIPEEYGGLGLDKISSALIGEKMSGGGGFSLSHGAHVGIGTLPIVLFGTIAQKAQYLPKLATGDLLAAYALTEPGSGSDALAARTTAVLNEAGTHYILNGEKQWITNAGFADVFVVYAKVDGEKFSAFIVERGYPGVSVGAEEKKMGIRSSSTRTLILQDVAVPAANVLGQVGKGHQIAFNILNIGRYKLAIGGVGGAKRALASTLRYATERKQFQTKIVDFALTREKVANMATLIYAAESAAYRTVGCYDEAATVAGADQIASIADYAVECSLNKVFSTEMLDYVVDESVQIHGGYGFMQEYDVERMYRDSRINRIFEGTNEINRLLIPGTLIRRALKNELPLFEAALALQQELLSYVPEEVADTPLALEKQLVLNCKKIGLLLLGLAAQKYGTRLEKEQEVLVNIADIITHAYTMESVILRTEKALATGKDSKQKCLYTQIFCQEAFAKVEADAKETILATHEGDTLRMMLATLRKLTRHSPHNLIALKREVAAQLVLEQQYCC